MLNALLLLVGLLRPLLQLLPELLVLLVAEHLRVLVLGAVDEDAEAVRLRLNHRALLLQVLDELGVVLG